MQACVQHVWDIIDCRVYRNNGRMTTIALRTMRDADAAQQQFRLMMQAEMAQQHLSRVAATAVYVNTWR